ncbi:hypothetical protein CPC08DRAFT_703413 [Agrocybe pediades]|nr:hypothetical protein CPC08DRAFT_703413 [Agrocybe pediades]
MQSVDQPNTGATKDCTPISRLYEDILWKIFLENTESFDNSNRLATARFSSHVCQQWRRLLLDAPSIWGRLLDLNELRTAKPAWVEEIMRRAGTARLWIRGPINRLTEHNSGLLLTFISENWTRIERLRISDSWLSRRVEREDYYDSREQYWHDLFRQPAPVLEEFVFRYLLEDRSHRGPDINTWVLPSPLFDASAPALQKFAVFRSGFVAHRLSFRGFTMDMCPAWFSDLRSFKLRQDYDVTRLLGFLKMILRLEVLEVVRSSNAMQSEEHNETLVKLPNLTYLRLDGWNLSDMVMFLESIAPCTRCCLSISRPPETISVLDVEDVKRAQIILMRYMQNYLQYYPIQRLTLSCNDQCLEIRETSLANDDDDDDDLPERMQAPFSIWMLRTEDDSSLFHMLFTSPLFFNVVELDLRKWKRTIPYPAHAFNSVTTLWIKYNSLKALVKHLEEGHTHIFPRLDVLKIGGRAIRVDVMYKESLYRFLKTRREVSKPVSVLDLSPLKTCDIYCNLDNLDKLAGLVVRFPGVQRHKASSDIREYVCGDGQPGLLRFGDTKGQCDIGCIDLRRMNPLRSYGWSGTVCTVEN